MSQPTEYERLFNFRQIQANTPLAPYIGAQHDAEFDAIALTLTETLANLALIQRDDGALANGVVTPDSLDTATINLIGDWNPRGAWVTATNYAVRDMVTPTGGSLTYVCNIAHTSGASFAIDLAAGKWQLVNGGPGVNLGFINVKDYGAVGDGVTDDTAAINLAIAAVNLLGGFIKIYFPHGRYIALSGFTPVVVPRVTFEGESKDGVVLHCHDNAQFTFGSASVLVDGCGVNNFTFFYPSGGPTTGAVCIDLLNCANVVIDNLRMEDAGVIIRMGRVGSTVATIIFVTRLSGYVYNIGVPAFEFRNGSGFWLDDATIFVDTPNVAFPGVPATAASRNVVTTTASWDTMFLSNCLFVLFDIGLNFAPSGANSVFGVFCNNVVFDRQKRWSVHIRPTVNAFVSVVEMTGCYFQSHGEDGIVIADSGVVADVNFTGGRVFDCSKNGVLLANTSIRNITFTGMQVYGVNGAAGAFDGFRIDPGVKRFNISDCRIGWNTLAIFGTNYQPRYGINVGADCDFYSINGGTAEGSTAGLNFSANSAGSTSRNVVGVTPNTYRGVQAGGLYVLPASTVAWTNTTPFRTQVYLRGGTVTVIAKNGTTITSATTADLVIEPGETFTVTYSVAPSATFFVIPS